MKNESNRYGKYKHLCTLIRLAAGEWKIQLTLYIDSNNKQQQSKYPTDKSSNCKQPSEPMKQFNMKNNDNHQMSSSSSPFDVTIIESISEILIATVAYLVQLVEQTNYDDDRDVDTTDNRVQCILSVVILHLRHSLLEAHTVAIQYIQLIDSMKGSSINRIDRYVIRVFTSLTCEIFSFHTNIYDNNQSIQKDHIDIPSVKQQLHALYITFDRCTKADINGIYVETLHLVASCILNVLASADGDTIYISIIQDHCIVGDTLVLFLDKYIHCMDNLPNIDQSEQIDSLCEIIELTVRIHEQCSMNESYKRRYQILLVYSMQRRLETLSSLSTTSPAIDVVTPLRRMVDCYISLQGSLAPNVTHINIIQQILQL
jgi:hypothetical protein